MNRLAIFLAAALALHSLSAGAAEDSNVSSGASTVSASDEGGWLLSGAPLGAGRNAFLVEVGWPGLNLQLLHGQSDRFDVGGNFTFVYGLEGVADIAPGLKLDAVLRLNLVNRPRYNIGLRFSPGIATYFPSSSVYIGNFCTWGARNTNCYTHNSYFTFGLNIPVEAVVGINVHPQVSLNLGVAIPMMVVFVPDVSFMLPIEPGFGVEYKVDTNLSITFDSRFGPAIIIYSGGAHAEFAFRVLVGVAYKF